MWGNQRERREWTLVCKGRERNRLFISRQFTRVHPRNDKEWSSGLFSAFFNRHITRTLKGDREIRRNKGGQEGKVGRRGGEVRITHWLISKGS